MIATTRNIIKKIQKGRKTHFETELAFNEIMKEIILSAANGNSSYTTDEYVSALVLNKLDDGGFQIHKQWTREKNEVLGSVKTTISW